jgi:hypothetical protein
MRFMAMLETGEDVRKEIWWHEGTHYLYSYTKDTLRDKFEEVMVFECDSSGNVTDWNELFVINGYEEASVTMGNFMQSIRV